MVTNISHWFVRQICFARITAKRLDNITEGTPTFRGTLGLENISNQTLERVS